jgi:hypothetical protein
MIFLDQAPYNVKADWTGSDATATDNWQAVQDAANSCQRFSTGVGDPDEGGHCGDTLVFPAGSLMVSQPLVLPPGVALQGANDYATNLIAKSTLDPSSHFIDLGDRTSQEAAFGSKIKNMCIWSHPNAAGGTGCMVYSNNAQDTDAILDGVRIYGFNRRCFLGEIGVGGASIVKVRQVSGNCRSPGMPAFTFNYGEGTLVRASGIEPSGGRKSLDPTSPDFNLPVLGTVGLAAIGGVFLLEDVHFEQADVGLAINLKSARCLCRVRRMTGGPLVNSLAVVYNNAAQIGRVRLEDVFANGALTTITNGQPGASAIHGDIVDQITL